MQMTPDGGFNSEVNNKLQQVCLCTTCAWQCMSDLSLRRQRLPCIQLDLSVNDIGAGVQQDLHDIREEDLLSLTLTLTLIHPGYWCGS